MVQITTSNARQDFAAALRQVKVGERVVISNHNKAVAAIVSMEDLAVLRALEDREDLAAAREALKEPGVVSWDDLKAELGLR